MRGRSSDGKVNWGQELDTWHSKFFINTMKVRAFASTVAQLPVLRADVVIQ
jgi:hypothetical protein